MRIWLAAALLMAGCASLDPEQTTDHGSSSGPIQLSPTSWSPPTDEVRPGDSVGRGQVSYSSLIPGGSSCTINFLFRNTTDLFFGTAAHCFGTDAQIGQAIEVGRHENGIFRAVNTTLAYSSWLQPDFDGAAHQVQCNSNVLLATADSALCWNDFALLRIDAQHWSLVHPAPRDRENVAAVKPPAVGILLWTRGEAQDRGATPERLDARQGPTLDVGAWHALAHFGIPGTAGDSGSPVTTADGAAVGTITYMHLAPPTANGISLLAPMLQAASEAGISVELVTYAP